MKPIHWLLIGAGAVLAWRYFAKKGTIVSTVAPPDSSPATAPTIPSTATESKPPLTIGGIRNPKRQNLPKLVNISALTDDELYKKWHNCHCPECRFTAAYVGFCKDVDAEVEKRNLFEKFEQKKMAASPTPPVQY